MILAEMMLALLLAGSLFAGQPQERYRVVLERAGDLDAAIAVQAKWLSRGIPAEVFYSDGFRVGLEPVSDEEQARGLRERAERLSGLPAEGVEPVSGDGRTTDLRTITEEDAQALLADALALLGTPYKFGGESTQTGLDCSYFTQLLFSGLGVELPRTARTQYRQGRDVPLAEVQPGDLIFFKNTYRRGISHVGVYLGGGEFIHAASGGARRVTISSLQEAYYRKRIAGVRRLLE